MKSQRIPAQLNIMSWTLMALLGALSALSSEARTNAPPAAITKVPEIVVTATRTGEDPVELPQTVLNITSEAIGQRQPSQPVEAVRDEPGIWVQKTGAGGGTPVVRGLMGNQVLYLVDGIRLNNGRLFSGPNAFFNQVDIGSIEQIEILKGPGSVQYGSDALGGVIQMRSKTLNRFPEKAEFGGLASGHFSSADQGIYGHAEAYYAGSKVNAIAGGSYFNADDYRAGGDEGTLDHTSLSSHAGFGKMQCKLGEGHVLTLGYLEDVRTDVERYDQSKRNQPSGLPRYFTPREDQQIVYLRDSLDRPGQLISHLEPYVYYQNYSSKSEYAVENDTDIKNDVTEADQHIFGGGLQAVTPVQETIKIVYGADARYEDLVEDKTRYTLTKATGTTKRSIPKGQTPDGTYDVVDAFVMTDWTPVERARITAGARVESTHLDSKPTADDASQGFTQDDLKLNERWNSATFSLGGIYWLTEQLALNSDIASGFRAPTYSDVLSFGPFTYGVNVPSPDVGPEKSVSWEIGPRYESDAVKSQITYFHTWLQDLIDSEPTGAFIDMNDNGIQDPGEAAYAKENAGKGWVQGLEASGEWTFLEPWTVFGSFAWTEGRNEDQDEYLRFIPPMNGILGLRYQITRNLQVEGFARIVGVQDKICEDDKSDVARATDPSKTYPSSTNPPLREDYSIPGYTTFHLRARYDITKDLKVYLLADNLTDKQYREAFSRLDAPGINFTLGAEVSF
ncbi:MAG: TonB-dependent receptor [Lentisphaerota bacterium]